MSTIVVNDQFQKSYVYRRTEPVGRRFDPGFKPDLTPKQLLELGVLGGVFPQVKTGEFPAHWATRAKVSDGVYRTDLNYFRVKPITVRGFSDTQKQRIVDPLGWFLWYCRYYMGRRIPDVDEVQIGRWKEIGLRRDLLREESCPSDVRQLLLEWAYDSRKK